MKFPKTRATLFLVERYTHGRPAASVCGAFSIDTEAIDFLDACIQDLRDKGYGKEIDEGNIVFKLSSTTFYG